MEQTGFQIESCETDEPYDVPPEDGGLATHAHEIGIPPRRMNEFIEAVKPSA